MRTIDEIREGIARVRTTPVTKAKEGSLFLHPELEKMLAEIASLKADIREFEKAIKKIQMVVDEEIAARFDNKTRKISGETVAVTRIFRTIRTFAGYEVIGKFLSSPKTKNLVSLSPDSEQLKEYLKDNPFPEEINEVQVFKNNQTKIIGEHR